MNRFMNKWKIFSLCCLLWCLALSANAVSFKTVFEGLKKPTDIKFLPQQSNLALVAQKDGELVFVNFEQKSSYLIHSFKVRTRSEMGLLGLALHPNFANNKKLFVHYTPKSGNKRSVISSFTLVTEAEQYRLTSETIILEVEQPYYNHNAGQLAFGPNDGYLYIAMGDGGSRNDPKGHGQNLSTLLGAILRIDIDNPTATQPYAIPKGNPFVEDTNNAKPEIWAYGLRNPWRFSFAPDGRLVVADVGQNGFEEVSIASSGSNLGWKIMEANSCLKPKQGCNSDMTLVLPKVAYGRSEGVSITGGYVYTGDKIPSLKQHYIYGDYISGNFWAAEYPSFKGVNKIIADNKYKVVAFAQDHHGELYAADLFHGKIYQLVP